MMILKFPDSIRFNWKSDLMKATEKTNLLVIETEDKKQFFIREKEGKLIISKKHLVKQEPDPLIVRPSTKTEIIIEWLKELNVLIFVKTAISKMER